MEKAKTWHSIKKFFLFVGKMTATGLAVIILGILLLIIAGPIPLAGGADKQPSLSKLIVCGVFPPYCLQRDDLFYPSHPDVSVMAPMIGRVEPLRIEHAEPETSTSHNLAEAMFNFLFFSFLISLLFLWGFAHMALRKLVHRFFLLSPWALFSVAWLIASICLASFGLVLSAW